MRILFLHQNFPGQFVHLAPALAADGHQVIALTSRTGLPSNWRGVRVFRYKWASPDGKGCHPWLKSLNTATARGEAVFRGALDLRARGLRPDIIVAHTGWGEALYVRDVWPEAKIVAFSELWYQVEGGDLNFDPEFPSRDAAGTGPRLRMKNTVQAMQIEQAHALYAPTYWQAGTYPDEIAARMTVLHEGVDTKVSAPNQDAVFKVREGPSLTRRDKVVSFVNRNLEPLRGFHVFMRALPDLLAREDEVHVVVVGETGVSYGVPPRGGGTWKDKLLAEIAPKLTDDQLARVHFVGRIPHRDLTNLFQVTRAHVYLTYPFVAGWSLLEAMSCAAPVVANTVAPVAEFVRNGDNGLLVDFFDREALVSSILTVMKDADLAKELGCSARKTILDTYDLHAVSLPKQRAFIASLEGASETFVADPQLARTG